MSRIRVFGATLLALSLTAFSGAQADTYLTTCATNGVLVSTTGTVTYDGFLPDPADTKNGSDTDTAILPGTIAFASPPPLTLFPATGDPKPDLISAQFSSRFEFGTPTGTTSQDSFEFAAFGSASALGALNTNGFPADAVVTVNSSAEFSVDPVPVGSCPGKIELAALRALAPYETKLSVSVTENPYTLPFVVALQSPGSPAQTVIVNPGTIYKIDLTYKMQVPFGIDPPFSLTIPYTVEAVTPVPAMDTRGTVLLVFMIASSALLFGLRAQARRAGATQG